MKLNNHMKLGVVWHYYIEVSAETIFREELYLRDICKATCDDRLIDPCIAVKWFVSWVLVFSHYS